MTSNAQTVIDLDRQRMAAMGAKDIATLNRLIGDDLIYVHSSARLDTKQSLIGAMESVSFTAPTGSLRIVDTASGVTVVVIGDLILAGANLEIDAPTIVVDSGVTIDTRSAGGAGSVTLAAADTQTGASPATASVTLDGATIHAKTIDLEATASQTPGAGSVPGINTVSASSAISV